MGLTFGSFVPVLIRLLKTHGAWPLAGPLVGQAPCWVKRWVPSPHWPSRGHRELLTPMHQNGSNEGSVTLADRLSHGPEGCRAVATPSRYN